MNNNPHSLLAATLLAATLAAPARAATTADMPTLRTKWQQMLTGGTLNQASPLAKAYIADVDAKAVGIWNVLIKKPDGATDTRTCLFADYPIATRDNTGSSQISLTYDRLRSLTLAYKMEGTSFYRQPIVFAELIAALDLMLAKHYSLTQHGTGSSSSGAYGNWYDWRIGTPLRYGDLLVMLHDELTAAQVAAYVEPILLNNKVVDLTGANLTWVAGIVAQAGVLKGDAALLDKAKAGLKTIFPYVTTGDGYYADGSFIQHSSYAYTGGYGKALLVTIGQLMHVLHGSAWAIAYDDGAERNLYDMLFEAYEPLIYGGRFMDMAREREIARLSNQDHIPGRQAIRAIALLLDVLPEEHKARAEAMLKEWLLDSVVLRQVCSDPIDGGFLEYYLTPNVIATAQALVNDNSITPRSELVVHKTFASMDRVVHRQPAYALGVAMSSPRIKNTEGTNNEGLKLWHISDGMTYLYTADKDEWAQHYWATVDHQRLPGTTIARATSRGNTAGYGTFNPNAWVGGTDLAEYGAAGMHITGLGASTTRALDAKKSWFMFDNEVVALGSGITLTSGTVPVETVIDNRRIKADGSNTIAINGAAKADVSGAHSSVSSLFVEQNSGANIGTGYYFPTPITLHALRETRTGKWSDVNTYAKYTDATPRTNTFATFWLSHGTAPKDSSYAYVLLPNLTPSQAQAYTAQPDITILQHDASIHAVREATLGITAINFWSAGAVDAYAINKPASLVAKANIDGTLNIALSDPTRSATSVQLTLDAAQLPIAEAVLLGDGVSLANNVLTFATQSKRGATLHAKLRLNVELITIALTIGEGVQALAPVEAVTPGTYPYSIMQGAAYTLRFRLQSGYELPEVKVGSSTQTIGAPDASGAYTITIPDLPRSIAITLTAQPAAPTAIAPPADGDVLLREVFYSFMGQELREPLSAGAYIVKRIYTSGRVDVRKQVLLDNRR